MADQIACHHGMPSPGSCIDCMNDGNLPVEPVERERRASNTPRVYCRFDGTCPVCNNPMTGLDYIVLTTHDRWVHEGCVP